MATVFKNQPLPISKQDKGTNIQRISHAKPYHNTESKISDSCLLMYTHQISICTEETALNLQIRVCPEVNFHGFVLVDTCEIKSTETKKVGIKSICCSYAVGFKMQALPSPFQYKLQFNTTVTAEETKIFLLQFS